MNIGFLFLLIFCFWTFYLWFWGGIACGLGGFLWMFWKGKVPFFSGILVVLVFLRVGFWMEPSYVFERSDDGVVDEFWGKVCFEPDIRREDVRYVLCVEEGGRVLWKTNEADRYELGDRVRLRCELEVPFEEDGFSYRKYLKIFKVDALCAGEFLGVSRSSFGIRKGILRLKNWMIGFFDIKLLEPVSSLMNGILFGSRRGFADKVMDDFARTGLTHIIAVSGYNVALVLLIVEGVFSWVPRRERFFVEILCLVVFAFLTGLSASVIRACIMGGLTLWAIRSGRKAGFWRVMLWCVVLMSFWNPAYLYYDISFHLSILATLGVVLGSKVFGFESEKDFLGLKEAFVMTLFAQVFTTPLVLRSFDYLSLVSPLANVLVAPFLPVLMFLGVLLLIVEFAFPFKGLSFCIVLVIEILGRAFFKIVELCSQLDFLVIELVGVDRFLLGSLYCLFFVVGFGCYSFFSDKVD